MMNDSIKTQCPICGGAITPTAKSREVRIGQRTVEVCLQADECTGCGEVFYTPDEMDTLQSRASETVRTQEGLLQPSAIRRIRESLGLSQAEFERFLGVGPKTVVRWEKGTVFQNGATDSLLRILDAVPEAAEYLAQVKGIGVRPTLQ